MFEITKYSPQQANEWNAFVKQSKQGTFLFDRHYMDYHSDRFDDFSLIVRHKQRIFALLPANLAGNTLYSHQGLTYGGLLTNAKATTSDVCEIFRYILSFLSKHGIHRFVYKAVPHIYHRIPAEEDLYALINVCNARIIARHISTTIALENRMKFAESRKSGIRKAIRNGIIVEESNDLAAFWHILNDNLHNKYDAAPVHSLAELTLLKSLFSNEISLFVAKNSENRPIGGTIVYETPRAIHTQYISASPEGKANGALDLLFDHILNKVYASHTGYFDFGKSSDGDGHDLNEQLIFQKEGFGGRGICYDTWEISDF